MLFFDFKYIDYAIGGVKNRNNVTTFEDAVQKIEAAKMKDEIHICIYRYTKDLLEHFNSKSRSVAGYRGECFADYIWIDIDRKDSPLHALNDCRKLVTILKNIDASSFIKIYFSGSKGFHLAIPIEYIKGMLPHKDLPTIFRFFTERLCGDVEIDKDLYRHLNMLRLHNTVNKKSGLYKIRITEAELFELTIQQIKELAVKPRTITDGEEDIRHNESLTAIFKEAMKTYEGWVDRSSRQSELADKQGVDYVPNNRKLCIYKLMRQGAPPGKRHDSLLRLAVHHKQEGYNENEVYALMYEWNKKNEDSKATQAEINASVKGVFKEPYDYGCMDPIKDSLCDKRCYIYPAKVKLSVDQNKELEKEIHMDQYISDVNILFRSYEKIVNETQWISIEPWLPTIAKTVRGYIGGTIIFWLAYTGIGKSMIKDNFNKHILTPSLNFELEQSRPVLASRKLQTALQLNNRTVEAMVKKKEYEEVEKGLQMFKHIFTVDQPGMSVKDIKEYYWYFCASWYPKYLGKPETPVKIPLINVDNLGDVEGGKGSSTYEKVSDKVRMLRLLCRELNIAMQVYAHIKRGDDNDGRKEPSLGSGKDSSVIENIADIVNGAWRPNYLKDGDNEMYIKNLKNRMGPAGTKVQCELITSTLTIREQKANEGLQVYKSQQGDLYEGYEDPF